MQEQHIQRVPLRCLLLPLMMLELSQACVEWEEEAEKEEEHWPAARVVDPTERRQEGDEQAEDDGNEEEAQRFKACREEQAEEEPDKEEEEEEEEGNGFLMIGGISSLASLLPPPTEQARQRGTETKSDVESIIFFSVSVLADPFLLLLLSAAAEIWSACTNDSNWEMHLPQEIR